MELKHEILCQLPLHVSLKYEMTTKNSISAPWQRHKLTSILTFQNMHKIPNHDFT